MERETDNGERRRAFVITVDGSPEVVIDLPEPLLPLPTWEVLEAYAKEYDLPLRRLKYRIVPFVPMPSSVHPG